MRASLSKLLPVGTIFKMAFTVLFVSAFACSFAQNHEYTEKEKSQISKKFSKLKEKDLDAISSQCDEYLDYISHLLENDYSKHPFKEIDGAVNNDSISLSSESVVFKYGDNQFWADTQNDNDSVTFEMMHFFVAIHENGRIDKTVDSVAITYTLLANRDCVYKIDYELIQRDSLEITNRIVRKIEEPILKD